jgi:site-specific recombinase XerD
MGAGIRGTQALLLAPAPSVPASRAIVSRRLGDHVHGFLLWLEHALARSPNTVKSYGEDVRMFVAFCDRAGIEYVEQVTFHHVEAFGASLRAHLAQRETSIARRYSALRKFFLYLERHELVVKNPAKLALTMKMPPRKPSDFMTKEERNKILAALRPRRDLPGRCYYMLTVLLFYSGLRESEIVNLRVEDVRLEAGRAYLHVHAAKGQKDRLVPIPPRLRDALRVYLTTVRPALNPPADKPWVIIHVGRRNRTVATALNTKTIWHFVQRVIVPILGRKVHPHTFRSSYATHLYEGGADPLLVKHLLGHVSLATTAIYAHVTPRKQREKLAAYLQ